jgi:phosphatidylinositol-3-phosphatase
MSLSPLPHTRRALAPLAALGVAAAVCAGCGSATAGRPLAVGPPSSLPASARSHVVLVVIVNAEYPEVIGSPSAPYINSLAARYGLATQSYAVTHPSLPNYLALTSGSTHGIDSDCTSCTVSAPNIVDQLEAAGLSWKAYMEDLPHPCFLGASASAYAKKHDPFAYYADIASNRARCERIVPFSVLSADLRAGALPAYSFVTPNLCDDAHDCSLQTADRFLARTLPPILRELGPRGFLVLTWDEGTLDTGCCGAAHGGRIATVLAGPGVRRGARMARPLDHYGVLATVEHALGLRPMGGAADPRAGSLAPLFARAPSVPGGRAASQPAPG